MIDLGAWATERYRVTGFEDVEQPESAGPGEPEGGA
jgi:endogenous inhibitor of DNA gyrase (YacG/DUF329 family)